MNFLCHNKNDSLNADAIKSVIIVTFFKSLLGGASIELTN